MIVTQERLLTIDDLRARGIKLYMHDGKIRVKGGPNALDTVFAAGADRIMMAMERAGGEPFRENNARLTVTHDDRLCKLCGGQRGEERFNPCLLCRRVVDRCMEEDEKARLVFIDTETTGLNRNCGVIEFAMIVVDRKTLEEVHAYEAKMPIRSMFAVFDEALQINGYSKEKWNNAIKQEQVYEEFQRFYTPFDIFSGWNTPFDVRMLRDTADILGIEWKGITRSMDLKPLISKALPGLPSYKLTAITSHLKIKHDNAHSAMADVRAVIDVYKWFRSHKETKNA